MWPKLIDDDMQTLNKIVHIDPVTYSAWVEPNVTMETLVQATLLHNLIPSVVADSTALLVGDAFAARTTGSSSFQFGPFDNTVLAIEIVRGDGQCVIARIDDPVTSELIGQSAGVRKDVDRTKSFDRTTLLNIMLLKAGPFVDIKSWTVDSVDEAVHRLRRAQNYSIDFVEGIMFGANKGVVTTGRFSRYPTDKDDFKTISTIEYFWYDAHARHWHTNHGNSRLHKRISH
jgi:delta24-sterol reductase